MVIINMRANAGVSSFRYLKSFVNRCLGAPADFAALLRPV